MVPLIISHDGAVHSDSVGRSNDFAPDITVDWVLMVQNVLRNNVVIVGKFFNEGAGSRRRGEKTTQKSLIMSPKDPLRECLQPRNEARSYILNLTQVAPCVCGLLARHLHTVLG